ncbi:DUF2332 domain-containing protein [Planosporangium sp. 12N6]|uniref:DUF2332 domain-containing protein n=1 Tax=Planosporangium spinosum TaxID=3402278 RepID=UPI003CED14D8
MTADRYRAFGQREARGLSSIYERLATAVAGDTELLDELPEQKRQPNLLFGAARYLDAPMDDPRAFRTWTLRHRDELTATMNGRRTQTNEPGRCAVLLPVLARLPQPLALLEVGASAGLCLYPDAYRYRYSNDPRTFGPADSPVELQCTVTGSLPLPERMPTVVWRAGLDLNPFDVASDDDLRWLDALIWPEQQQRRDRLRAAARIARSEPPHLLRGDLLTHLPTLASQAPAGATLVIFHTAVLPYVSTDTRTAFVDLVRPLPCHWISNEGLGVTPGLAAPAAADGPVAFQLALDGQVVALTAPHGQGIRWLEPEINVPVGN